MKERRPDRGISVGVTSLAVILTILALTVFAVLALSTAANDARLAREYARSVEAWWAADCAAEEAETALRRQWEADPSPDAAAAAARALGCETRLTDAGVEASLLLTIDEARTLSVRWLLGEDFTVTAWQTVPAGGDWQPDDRMELWP